MSFAILSALLFVPTATAADYAEIIKVNETAETLTMEVLDTSGLLGGFELTALYDDGESSTLYRAYCEPKPTLSVLDCGLFDLDVQYERVADIDYLNIDFRPLVDEDLEEVGIVTSHAKWVTVNGLFSTWQECVLEDGDQEACEDYYASAGQSCGSVEASAMVQGANCKLACTCKNPGSGGGMGSTIFLGADDDGGMGGGL